MIGWLAWQRNAVDDWRFVLGMQNRFSAVAEEAMAEKSRPCLDASGPQGSKISKAASAADYLASSRRSGYGVRQEQLNACGWFFRLGPMLPK